MQNVWNRFLDTNLPSPQGAGLVIKATFFFFFQSTLVSQVLAFKSNLGSVTQTVKVRVQEKDG